MNTPKQVWGFAEHEQDLFTGSYDTEAEAIEAAPIELDLEPGDTFYTGTGAVYIPEAPDVLSMLEQMQERANDDCGEVAEDWEPHLQPVADLNILEAALHKIVLAWMQARDLMPTFWMVDNVTEHTVPGDPEDEQPEPMDTRPTPDHPPPTDTKPNQRFQAKVSRPDEGEDLFSQTRRRMNQMRGERQPVSLLQARIKAMANKRKGIQ